MTNSIHVTTQTLTHMRSHAGFHPSFIFYDAISQSQQDHTVCLALPNSPPTPLLFFISIVFGV